MSESVEKKTNSPEGALKEAPTDYHSADSEIDLTLLRDSLSKSPWERMQANDDALNFAESLQTAMKKRRA
jgi:hypothetical protein